MNIRNTDLMKNPSQVIMHSSRSKKSSRMARSARSSTIDETGRHKVLHNYHDHSHVIFPSEVASTNLQGDGNEKRKGPRGGVTMPFPTKLHVMLSKVEESGLSHIVSWWVHLFFFLHAMHSYNQPNHASISLVSQPRQPHGRCFVVHKPKEFVAEIMSIYFRQSKLTSFQRQLNLYGFARITTGPDRGGYYHEYFLKHKLFLCQQMVRSSIHYFTCKLYTFNYIITYHIRLHHS